MTNSTEMTAKINQFLRKNFESEFLITTILISIFWYNASQSNIFFKLN
jgi:hypothetical protein